MNTATTTQATNKELHNILASRDFQTKPYFGYSYKDNGNSLTVNIHRIDSKSGNHKPRYHSATIELSNNSHPIITIESSDETTLDLVTMAKFCHNIVKQSGFNSDYTLQGLLYVFEKKNMKEIIYNVVGNQVLFLKDYNPHVVTYVAQGFERFTTLASDEKKAKGKLTDMMTSANSEGLLNDDEQQSFFKWLSTGQRVNAIKGETIDHVPFKTYVAKNG